MNLLRCVYKTSTGVAVTGRSRLFGVISMGDYISPTTFNAEIKLYNGSSGSSPLVLQFADDQNSQYGSGYAYGSGFNSIDLPSEGILFSDGIYLEVYSDIKGISLFVCGGT